MKMHHRQSREPDVLRQTSLDENLVVQVDPTLSSDTSHRPFAFSNSVPVIEPPSALQLTSHASTSLFSDNVSSASSPTSEKRPGALLLKLNIGKQSKLEEGESVGDLSVDPYVTVILSRLSFFNDCISCYSSMMEA